MNGSRTVQHAKELSDNHASLFKPASWLTKIEFINQLVLGTNVLISVLGEQGGGKSSFIELLQMNLDKRIRALSLAVTPLFDWTLFLSHLHTSLGCEHETTLNELIEKSRQSQTHTLVILDDAQYLSESFLDELLNALQQQGPQGYFHLCLVADGSLTAVLNKLEGKYQDMIHSIELGPLNESETRAYVKHRLLAHPEFITDELLKQFYQLTEGNIVGINTQMPSFFNLIKPAPKNRRYLRLPMVAGVIVAALSIAFILQPNSPPTPSSTEPVIEVALPPEFPEVAQADVALASEIPPYDVAASRQFLQPTELRRAELIVSNNEEDDITTDDFVVMDKVVVIPKVIQAKAEPVKAREVKTLNTQASISTVKQQKPVSVKLASMQDHYTIQLLASHSRAKLEHFAQLYHIKNQSRILRAKKPDGVWYVLTFGDYHQRDAARQAIMQLPQGLAKFKPWVRSFSELQNIG
ncbi:SPOR domain-containing protein [Legionella oakridgensis]|uniref:DamX-related protein n=1 Tax=Legionella oakridgensis TaxID=29423 RepID=A0A0W0X0I9_9GAMM|nr:SPOR domain-containing protein [Legionella oakridgensis]KTD38091.1 DamX-related protein [Legionella oakridgensis]STY19851.1 DamX-like protein [Legionella longbeachae]